MPNVESIKKEYDEILEQLSNPELLNRGAITLERLEELSKKRVRLEKIIIKYEELQELKNKIEENQEIIKAQEDKELVSLAEIETNQLQEKKGVLEKELQNLLAGKRRNQEAGGAAIVEIRAGTGGEEAALFAADLFRMYSKYADHQGWKQKTLDSQPTELGGFKQIVFELKNGNVLSKIQYEGGVHRIQRIPTTEKSGRIHTSTASVAVLPKPKGTDIKINPNDLKVDVYKSSGPGGQYVNKRMTAVRMTHLPTGLVVTSQTERNLQQNKESAMAILAAKLQGLKEKKEIEKLSEKRKAQIKRAMRADKIRTYNFPQDRVTDHRLDKSFHNIESIMNGHLDSIIESLPNQLNK